MAKSRVFSTYYEDIKKANERWLARDPVKKRHKTEWHDRRVINSKVSRFREKEEDLSLYDDIFDYGDFFESRYA